MWDMRLVPCEILCQRSMHLSCHRDNKEMITQIEFWLYERNAHSICHKYFQHTWKRRYSPFFINLFAHKFLPITDTKMAFTDILTSSHVSSRDHRVHGTNRQDLYLTRGQLTPPSSGLCLQIGAICSHGHWKSWIYIRSKCTPGIPRWNMITVMQCLVEIANNTSRPWFE